MKKTVGQKIRELRKDLGLTTEELAIKCNVTKQRINFFELDKGLPTIPTLLKLSKGLECNIFDILDEPFERKDSMCIHFRKCMFYNRKLENEK